jgi:hypothetical protein
MSIDHGSQELLGFVARLIWSKGGVIANRDATGTAIL